MAQKITIIAKQVTPPSDSAYLFFGLDFGNTSGSYLNTSIFFVSGSSNYPMGQVKYNQANTSDFAQELFNYFSYQFTSASVPFTYDIDLSLSKVAFYLGNNATVDYFNYIGNDFIDSDLWSLTREDYTFPSEPETITYDEKVILSRSPYFFSVSPSVLYDSINANVYIYRGDKADIPLIETYNVSKSVIQAGQSIISFDLHKLLNDFTRNSFNQTVSSGVQTVSNFDSVWCYIDCDVMLNGVSLYKVKQTLLAVDGFGFHEELANPDLNKKVLSTINNHIIYNDSKYPIYFVSKDLASITANGVNVPFTLNSDLNNQYFGYLDATQYAGIDTQFNIIFEYTTEEITHSFEIKNECRDNLINCIFKNKYGFWQKIPFNKLSKKSMDMQSKDYMPVVSNFGSYFLNAHNKRSYLTNGTRKITCNTDFLPEYYNSLFTELMLSEQIYLEESGIILPVNINTKSINYKTKLNDKLIQYSMDFEYSYNVLNNVI